MSKAKNSNQLITGWGSLSWWGQIGFFALAFVVVGLILLTLSRAASPFISAEVESATLADGASEGSDANASGGEYVQFGNYSPPVNGVYSTIGVVGCSNTGEHAVGYRAASSQDRLWAITRAMIGGGSMKTWYSGINQPGNDYWDVFTSFNTSDPPDAVWIQMCIRTNEDASADGMTVAQQNQLTAIIAEVHDIAGANVDIIVSPLNIYDPSGLCHANGTFGVENAVELADWAVSTGLADVRGPDTGPVNSSHLEGDLCHLNSSGEALVGAQLVDFFDD